MSIEAMKHKALEIVASLAADKVINKEEEHALRTAIATEESSATQEPVAWMEPDWADGTIFRDSEVNKTTDFFHDFMIPLYTHPQPKAEQPKVRTGDCLLTGVCASEGHKIQPKAEQEQKREPLTDEMRKQMEFLGYDTLMSRTPFIAGWLKAEAAHGIKGEA